MSGAERIVWLSGSYLPESRARVPATSPALLLGVAAFETLRLVEGEAPLLARHLARLRSACDALGIGCGDPPWEEVVHEVARRNGLRNGVVRITVAAEFALATCRPLPMEFERERRDGIALPLHRLQRSVPALKGTSRLDLWLGERALGGEFALLDFEGGIRETSRSSFFAVTQAGLETGEPPDVLPGIARGLVLETACALGLAVVLRVPRLAEREHWREAFATNAVRGVRGVRALGGAPLPAPVPGPVTRRLQLAFDAALGL